MTVAVGDYIGRWPQTPFAGLTLAPWAITTDAAAIVAGLLPTLGEGYVVTGQVAAHRTAEIEPGAILKGPAVIGPRCLVAAGAYLRGGVFLDEDCIAGPAVELKTTLMFKGAKVAHLSFVGDSILGARVNVEAGAMIANYRNELADKRIRIGDIDTGVEKFGALVGDDARIGANAVIAPGALLARGVVVPRLGLVNQSP